MQKTKPVTLLSIFYPQTFHFDFPASLDECVARIKYYNHRKGKHSNELDVNYVPIHTQAVKIHMRRQLWFNFEVELLAQLDQISQETTSVNGIVRIPTS